MPTHRTPTWSLKTAVTVGRLSSVDITEGEICGCRDVFADKFPLTDNTRTIDAEKITARKFDFINFLLMYGLFTKFL